MTPKTAPGRGRIAGLATAVPPLKASVEQARRASKARAKPAVRRKRKTA